MVWLAVHLETCTRRSFLICTINLFVELPLDSLHLLHVAEQLRIQQ
jgi:hypothetical protein